MRESGHQDSPIENTNTIDTVVRLKGGGAYYGLVIVKPLAGDEISQNRLLTKIEKYIQDFYSEKSLELSGRPTIENSRIFVRIHPASDPVIFKLLERCREWVESHHIEFKVDTDLRSDSTAPH
jgi:hypothetical protein